MRTSIRVSALALLPLFACNSDRGSIPAELDTQNVEAHPIEGVANVHVYEGILTSGQPTAQGLAAAHAAGVRTVLNYRTAPEMEKLDFDEAHTVLDLGMEYVLIPWNGPDAFTDDVIDETRKVLNDSPRPILFHCGSANRVGGSWIAWRVLDGGVDLEQAVAEAKEIGLKTPEYETKAREYVARHK